MRKVPTESLTRKKLLEAAEELMSAKGYNATSVEEICGSAGLTKGSFFHYFEGKEHLGKLLAERSYTATQQVSRLAPFRQENDPLDRVFGYLDFLIEMSHTPMGKRCLLGTFVQELSETHPQIRAVCATCLDDQAAGLRQDLDEAKAKYAPGARWNTQSLAEHLIAVVQGAIIVAKAKQDQEVIEDHLVHFKGYLRSLFET